MRDARIELPFGDDTYSFRLGYGELIEVQEKTDCGPFVLYERLRNFQWKVQDLYAVVRCGLIGGGMTPVDAMKLADRYVKQRPPMENHHLAFAILAAGIMGAADETIEDKRAKAAADDGDGLGKLKVAELFKVGAIMGMTPKQVKECSIWELRAAAIGWADFNDPEAQTGNKLTEAEKQELDEFVKMFSP